MSVHSPRRHSADTLGKPLPLMQNRNGRQVWNNRSEKGSCAVWARTQTSRGSVFIHTYYSNTNSLCPVLRYAIRRSNFAAGTVTVARSDKSHLFRPTYMSVRKCTVLGRSHLSLPESRYLLVPTEVVVQRRNDPVICHEEFCGTERCPAQPCEMSSLRPCGVDP